MPRGSTRRWPEEGRLVGGERLDQMRHARLHVAAPQAAALRAEPALQRGIGGAMLVHSPLRDGAGDGFKSLGSLKMGRLHGGGVRLPPSMDSVPRDSREYFRAR